MKYSAWNEEDWPSVLQSDEATFDEIDPKEIKKTSVKNSSMHSLPMSMWR